MSLPVEAGINRVMLRSLPQAGHVTVMLPPGFDPVRRVV